MTPTGTRPRQVPPRALALSLLALAVPVSGALFFPEALGDYGALLWLAALVPAFLLAYYRGWRGVATALAVGMATLSCTQAVATWLGGTVPDLLLAVVVVYLVIALGIGWLAELLHRERHEVEDMAFTDLLTRLPNRRHARVFLENEFAAAERGRLLALVLLDLDHFKSYNDRFGHQAGDDALVRFADILATTTRRMNLSARFGGEEFVAILAGSDAEGAVVFAERVRGALRSLGLGDPPLTVSIGVAAYHPSMRTPDELIAAADHAMYQAKREGRNCTRLFGQTGAQEADPAVEEPDPPAAPPRPAPRPAPAAGDDPQPPLTLQPHQITGFGAGRRLLLVEDDTQVRALIASYLEREGFTVVEAGDAPQGIRALASEFDTVITDIRLPGAAGNEVVAAVKARWPRTQVLVITGLQDAQVAAAALKAGADRYLFKPFGMPELRGHLIDALDRRDRVSGDLERPEAGTLSAEDDARARKVRASVLKGAGALVRAAELRDPHTRGHGRAVARYAAILGPELDPGGALLDPGLLQVACEFLDIGKIGVPDHLLNKEGPLTPAERAQLEEHPRTGRRILEPLIGEELILAVVSWHHERWDGQGYPDGLVAEAIPLAARVVAVADALDAMTRTRAFRPARPWHDAMEELVAGSGTHFDPRVVAAARRREGDLRAEYVRMLSEERGRPSEDQHERQVADDPAQG